MRRQWRYASKARLTAFLIHNWQWFSVRKEYGKYQKMNSRRKYTILKLLVTQVVKTLLSLFCRAETVKHGWICKRKKLIDWIWQLHLVAKIWLILNEGRVSLILIGIMQKTNLILSKNNKSEFELNLYQRKIV